jgi:sigma-B regulation protein RsbU (phosphoserine phosphatase)
VVLETMAPAFAIRALFDGFHGLAPEYSFRSPSLNPTRREDLATDLEAGLIRRFDEDRGLDQLSGFATVNGTERFYVAKPITTVGGCLACHGRVEDAPPVMTVRYGTMTGHGWPLDRIINARVIYVPTADLKAFQRRTLWAAGATFVLSHAVLFLILFLLLDRLVGRRMRRVPGVMDEAALAPGRPIAIPDGRRDEIGVVSRAFNRMAASLVDAYQTLERRVEERTRQLAQAKGEVEVQLARLDQELQAARELQVGLVPTVFPPPTPERPIETAAAMEPALEVGGDLYDVIDLGQGRVCAVIGDVAGKGAAAALFMALTLSQVRAAARHAEPGPGFTARVVEAVNRELCARNPSFMFVTLQVLLLDGRTGAVEIANAGHLPPWRLDADGATPLPEAPSLALGIDPDMTYTSETAQLRPGEALALLTDGVIEARDRDGELFGEERLGPVLAEVAGQPPAAVIEAVIVAVRAFEGGTQAADDLTMLVLRRLGGV